MVADAESPHLQDRHTARLSCEESALPELEGIKMMTRVNLLSDGTVLDRSDWGEPDKRERRITCPGCLGRGRYVGLTKVEDPCSYCGGTGQIPEEISFANL